MLFDIGIYGLGTMGSALARNMSGRGYSVAAYSREPSERERMRGFAADVPERERMRKPATEVPDERPDARDAGISVYDTLDDLVACLSVPRRVVLMVTAGPAVDEILADLVPLLSPGDVILDCGNSWYLDTARRQETVHRYGLHYLGVGISGGERGALEGPSIMAGGDLPGWELCADLLQACAAETNDDRCCRYLGHDGAGHYVKMVHNGIEYGMLELIAEAWQLMRDLLHLRTTQTADVFDRWRRGKLASFLTDTATVVLHKNDEDGRPLVDRILDVAEQNGTGLWTVREGFERGVYIPTIVEALSMRNHSMRRELRRRVQEATGLNPGSAGQAAISLNPGSTGQTAISLNPDSAGFSADARISEETLCDALYAGFLLCYSQGLELIYAASRDFSWDISLPDVVGCWKAGCIIRADMLSRVEKALPDAFGGNLLLSAAFRPFDEMAALRRVVAGTATAGLSAPAFFASLSYYDACRAGHMPVNLIQGMRDSFGAHGFRRTDRDGLFHAEWDK